MTDQTVEQEDNLYSPEEMKDWLRVEATQVQLAAKRRIREAEAFVDAYMGGRLTREEANQRLNEHDEKWGEMAKDAGLASEIHDEAVAKVYRLRVREKRGLGSGDLSR